MPGTWPGGDPAGDDDADDGELAPPVHPDDRLWRHPSEMAWTDPTATSVPTATTPVSRSGRVWALALTSALTGAVLALGSVALIDTIGSEAAGDDGGATLLRQPGLTPTGLASVAESVLPSVVRIEVDGAAGHTTGTGVVIVDDGHILTNAHVVEGADSITLLVADGTAVPGRVVGVDWVTDVAVLAPTEGHTGDAHWSAARLGSTDDLEIGQAVVVVGAAATDDAMPSVAFGVVAALGLRVVTADGDALHEMIETDTPVPPTATGGALCDEAGAVVGLSTTRAGGAGAGYATPIEAAWAVAEALMEEGAVHHVWLGIEGTDRPANPSGTATSLTGRSGTGGGVLVERVVDASPAAQAGLLSGDVLVDVDGEAIATMSDLVVALRRHEPGEEVELSVLRGDEVLVVGVTLAER